jgi:hypothetical protein
MMYANHLYNSVNSFTSICGYYLPVHIKDDGRPLRVQSRNFRQNESHP